MPELQPSWQLSLVTAALLAALAVAARTWPGSRPGSSFGKAGAFGQEFAIVMSLLALWQFVGGYVHTREAGAFERAASIVSLERDLHLPGEAAVQQLVLPHPWLVGAVDRYYAYAHLNGTAVFLVLLWWRRRDVYPAVRVVVVLATLACLLVQIVPVAPPRLLPGAGFVDTALLRGESVYGPYGTGMANQLSAMPSVHVAWASIVAWYLWRYGPRRGGWVWVRWFGVVHLVVTVFVVVASANHWWLDGIVAAGFVALAVPVGEWWRRRTGGGASEPALEPALEPAPLTAG